MKLPADILEAISDPAIWGRWFERGDWTAWRAFLAAVFGLPMTPEMLAIFQRCTGRVEPPASQAREVWACVGRRAGKTRIMATVAAFMAVFRDWSGYLAPGERATIQLISADRKQARQAMNYLRSLILDHPEISKLVVNETKEALDLSNRVSIEITTASFRSSRGYSVPVVLCDEIAFWFDSADSANPADEILNALRPSLASMEPDGLLLGGSNPHARRGPLWEASKLFGKPGDELFWRATTREMRPGFPQHLVDREMERDPSRARSEFLAEFRTDIEGFLTKEALDAVLAEGRHEMPPRLGEKYYAGVDMSGGISDSAVMAIAHREGKTSVLDLVREVQAPFDPDAAIAEFCEVLRRYRVDRVTGDRYGGEFPRQAFRRHGIQYKPAEVTKSDYYRELLPLINSGRVELLDLVRLRAQLLGLERRVARGGKDNIDHGPGAHDDAANAAAIALVLAQPREPAPALFEPPKRPVFLPIYRR